MNTQQILKLVGNMHGQGSAPISSPLGLHIDKQLVHKLVQPCITTLQPVHLLDYSFLFHKKVMLCHKEHSKHLYIHSARSPKCSPHLTLKTHAPFNSACDDKINDCGFNLSVAYEQHVLIEENKDNLLQLTKVFPTKFLKLLIRQSFLPLPFCAIRQQVNVSTQLLRYNTLAICTYNLMNKCGNYL